MTLTPTYQLSIKGQPLELNSRLLSINIIDKRGIEADELMIEINDTDEQIALPSKQAIIDISLGFKEQDQFSGQFSVDVIELAGPPDKITIRAKGAKLADSLTEQRNQSWHQTNVAHIIKTIADSNQLESIISDKYQSEQIAHIDQTNESDAHFLTRLAALVNAICSIKSGKLIFIEQADGKTASRQAIPPVTILKSQCQSYNYSQIDRQKRITGVKAFYTDKQKATKEEVSAGQSGYMRNLKQTFADKAQALAAAISEFKAIKNQAGRLDLTLATGNTLLAPETPVIIKGFKKDIDNARWLVEEANHSINAQGFITSVKLFEVE